MKKMSLLTGIILAIIIIIGAFASNSEARWSGNDRRAVVLEAFYALRPSHDGGCDKTINGNCISDWNYLNNDPYAYNAVKERYGSDSSVWSLFYSSLPSYGYSVSGGSYGQVGRGGQCKYFSDLILYRSEATGRLDSSDRPSSTGNHTLPSYSTMWPNTEIDLQKAKEGDIILVYNVSGYTNHVAIVVEIKKSGNTITGLDVIDSNFISDINGAVNREVIGRHLFQLSSIQGVYRIWKGTRYYNDIYCPTC